jgi:hypothetical protein
MSAEPREIVLLTRFRLTAVLRVMLQGRGFVRQMYYDPYGTLHGPVFRLLVALAGRPRVAACIDRTARLLRVPLRQVPHGQGVPDYEALEMGANIDATLFLDETWRDGAYHPDVPVPAGVVERDELLSLHLKVIGMYGAQLIENIRVIRALEQAPPVVRLNLRLWPAGFVSCLERFERVRVVDEGRAGVLPDLLMGALVGLLRLCGSAWRWRRGPFERSSRNYVLAAELIDPRTLRGWPAEPNFLAGPSIPPSSILYYIQPERRPLFRKSPPGLGDATVVDLSRLPLRTQHVRFIAAGCWRALRAAYVDGIPVIPLLAYIDYVRKFALLSALFERFRVGVHLYHAYPMGRVGKRDDSGLVTAVCRRHGVHSFSYQTRAHFGWRIEYCFDCFDTYCVWGEWWRDTYKERVAIRNMPAVGDVFLDGLELQRSAPKPTPGPDTVVVFTGDVHTHGEPSYWTLDYAIEFLCAAVIAVGRINGSATGRQMSIVIKPKQPRHRAVFEADARLAAAMRDAGTSVAYLPDEIHDIAQAASLADFVLSLLPTTPGMDLLLSGKPSAYFNTLTWGDPRFDSHPLLVRDADEIEAFLRGHRGVKKDFLNTLDPWRDGASRERIAQHVLAAGREKPCAQTRESARIPTLV